MSYSEEIMKVHEYAMNLIECKNQGLKEVPIEYHEQLLECYIESLHYLEKSSENFDKLVEMFGVKI